MATDPASAEQQLADFIAKFHPNHADLIRTTRAHLRSLMPTANELVYDNYNFFVIGYCTTLRPSNCILSIAAAANGVGISFYHGADLPDPHHLLQGAGVQNRFLRIPSPDTLTLPDVHDLITAAIAQAAVPLPPNGHGELIIQSISAKQKPRRKP